MAKELPNQPYRDVQTLLFCKIASVPFDNSKSGSKTCDDLYKMIYQTGRNGQRTVPRNQSARTFLTLGSYDAICVYPTKLDPNSPDWLHQVYYDKQQIIRKPSNNIIYHQMHLVSQHEDTKEFWNIQDKDYPFFLTTLIYGVNISNLRQEKKAELEETGRVEPEHSECSKYEQMIRLRLRKRLKEMPVDVKYAVYNGITVSDVVILWRAKDFLDVMDIITYIEYSGISRKTLTSLGFPINANGQVKSCVTDALVNKLDKSITLCMHGAIRSIDGFLKIQELLAGKQSKGTAQKIGQSLQRLVTRAYTETDAQQKLDIVLRLTPDEDCVEKVVDQSATIDVFRKKLQPRLDQVQSDLFCAMPKHSWSQSLGKNDFTVSARVSYANLANLLDAHRIHYKILYSSCWEILTDIRRDHPTEHQHWFHESKYPSEILCSLYNSFQELYSHSNSKFDLRQFSWFDALQELLGTHHYIDHHPVLHGPSYLVYKSLKIVYSYFAGEVTDYESLDKRLLLLKRSEESIIHFIRNLDQLTEQISRNDDAMLNNRSNTHTIHFSLPESALEFYHAFLRRVVDYLMCYDDRDHRIPSGFEYDFLLSPKTCCRFQFRPMLKTDHQDHNYHSDKIWPQKQAYILELPLESIFNPLELFIPIVHECFHCFGDALRQREHRRQYMSLFIANNLVTDARLGLDLHRALSTGLAVTIHDYCGNRSTPYLTNTWQQLQHNTYELFGIEGSTILAKKGGIHIPAKMLQEWEEMKGRLHQSDIGSLPPNERTTAVDSILNNCKVLFKECYADAMTIALLKLSPWEYLKCTRGEIRRFHDSLCINSESISHAKADIDRASLAERFATVLAACHLRNGMLEKFSLDECINAIHKYARECCTEDSKDEFYKFAQIMLQIFQVLVDRRKPLTVTVIPNPPSALGHVVDYLTTSIDLLYQDPPTLEIKPNPDDASETSNEAIPYTLKNLADDFNVIIREGNMFSERFYTLIYEHHQIIRNETNPQEPQHQVKYMK